MKRIPLQRLLRFIYHDLTLQVKGITIDLASNSMCTRTTNPNIIIYTVSRTMEGQKIRQFVIPDTKEYVEKMIQSRDIEFERVIDSMEMKNNFEKKLNDSKEATYTFARSARSVS